MLIDNTERTYLFSSILNMFFFVNCECNQMMKIYWRQGSLRKCCETNNRKHYVGYQMLKPLNKYHSSGFFFVYFPIDTNIFPFIFFKYVIYLKNNFCTMEGKVMHVKYFFLTPNLFIYCVIQ